MPNNRITRTSLLVGTALAGPVYLTRAALLGAINYPGPIRVTRTSVVGAVGYPGPMRMTHTQGLSAVNYSSPMRITYFAGLRAQSLNRVFYLTRLESTSTITPFGAGAGAGTPGGPVDHGWQVELVAGPIPEFNPYKPQVPESLLDIEDGGREIFDWLEEQQKTIRLQHNITQAGDSTFPFQMIINTHTDKHYTLGSVGKFYHEHYGMILARYVQFDKMDPNIQGTAPVGLIRETGNLEWVVTNRLDISSSYLCVGVNASYVTPVDGSYGWVIIDGANLQPLVTDGESGTVGEAFVWSATGQVSTEGEGVIIARRVDENGDPTLLRGHAWIRLESLSKNAIVVALDEYIQAIAQLQADVLELQQITGVNGALDTLQSQLTVLSNRLTAEEAARQAADAAINAKIANLNFVTADQLNAAIHNIETSIVTITAQLNNAIDATNAIAVEALAKANQALAINTDAIIDQISQILAMIAELNLRPKGRFPIVDGSVPPNLVYTDDGSLVYMETY